MANMDTALKSLRIIQVAFISSVILYMLVGEVAGRRPAMSNPTIAVAIAVIAASTVAIIAILRRIMLMPAAAVLSSNPSDGSALTRWRAATLVVLALCESIGLYGLVLRFLGFTLTQTMPFYLAAILMMLYFGPKRPVAQ
jgi:hypothetical protein